MAVPPYVVLFGDVGTGKSTLVEKLTGAEGQSSDGSVSVTATSEVFTIPGKLVISDTPGSNAMANKFMHNIWIAEAMNFRPVSLVLNTVKADTRIDNVIETIRKYAECFMDLPPDSFGVCVTHMDQVNWTKTDLMQHIQNELGIDAVVFSAIDTQGEKLGDDILEVCKRPHNITVDSENFLKLFKINDNNLKILRSTRKEVADFETMKQCFYIERRSYSQQEQTDLIFEFQAWMSQEIIEAQKRVSNENCFTYCGKEMANEAGHIANMTNQLRAILFDVRTETLNCQTNHGVSSLRRCPHCGLVWAKIEGCDGNTTCGNLMGSRDSRYGALSTFSFAWNRKQLVIQRISCKTLLPLRTNIRGVGCGGSISWNAMAPVQVPAEFYETPCVSVEDIKLIPKAAKRTWNDAFNNAKSRIKIKFSSGFPSKRPKST